MVNLSATGILVDVATPAQVGERLDVMLPWQNQVLQLFGRVVRCSPHYRSDGHMEWRDPESYRIAIEFIHQDTHTATTLSGLLRHAAAFRQAD
jgi:hypothetical protein